MTTSLRGPTRVPLNHYHQAYGCTRTTREVSEVQAAMSTEYQQRPRGSGVIYESYECVFCGWWHVGRVKSRKDKGL